MKEQEHLEQADKLKSQKWPKVAIVILNWNGWRDTIECLESLLKITHPNYQVIVVDNGSTDGSVEKIKTWAREKFGAPSINLKSYRSDICEFVPTRLAESPEITLLSVGENLGFSNGCNLAIEWALQDQQVRFVFLLNNDAKPDPSAISICVDVAQDTGAGCIGSLVKNAGVPLRYAGSRFPHDLFRVSRIPLPKREKRFWEVDVIGGAAMLIQRDALYKYYKKYGYFLNPALFMYYEESEFCYHLRQMGYRCLFAGKALVYHAPKKLSSLRWYYETRNRIYLARRVLPFPWKLLFHLYYGPSRLLRVFQRLLQGDKHAAFAILSGLVDGYIGKTGKWIHHDDGMKKIRSLGKHEN